METKHQKEAFLELAATRSVNWHPEINPFPKDINFLFVTSAIGKIRGLAESGLKATFLAWSPINPPSEPNNLTIDGLIIEKAKNLVVHGVSQLRGMHRVDRRHLPQRYLVQDVHPSLGHPGSPGEEYLVKPKEEMGYVNLVKFVYSPWIKYENKPVTVQLASAFAMVNQEGVPLGSRSVKKDSVFITYSKNPFENIEDVENYIEMLKMRRFPGYSKVDLVAELSKVAGGVFHEYLYLFARNRGIDVTISNALSCKLPEHDAIYGIGAAGLTPAIVGWIGKQARMRVN